MVVLLMCGSFTARSQPWSRRWLENEFLHAPRLDFARDDLVRIAAIHHVNHLESGGQLAGMAELAEHRAVQFRFINFAGDVPRSWHVPVGIRVRHEHVLVRARRNAHGPADAQIGNLANRLQVVVEHLVAEIGAVGDPDVPLPVHLQAVRQIEFSQRACRPFRCPPAPGTGRPCRISRRGCCSSRRKRRCCPAGPSPHPSAGRKYISAPAGSGRRGRPATPSDGRRPAAQHHQHLAFGAELRDHVGALVDGPDVVVLIDAHRMGEFEAVIARCRFP